MHKKRFLPRILALFLTLSLALPGLAAALRQTGLEEQEVNGIPLNHKQTLLRALTSDAPATGLEEPLQVIQAVFKEAPKRVKPQLEKLFEARVRYFDDSQRLAAFKRRAKKFGPRMLKVADYQKLYDPAVHNPFYGDVLFLMLARGTVKDLVWEHAQDGKSQIEAAGGRPSSLLNLFEPSHVKGVLKKTLEGGVFKNPQALSDEIEWLTGHPLSDFQQEDRLFEIFADQVVEALRETLPDRKRQLPRGDRRIGLIKSVLADLRSDTRGKIRFVLTDRSIESLKGGDKAGDCTACGSFSAWTAASWNATFENFELQTYYQGDFFARFIGMLGQSGGKLVIWIHAVEFTPLARATEGASSESKFSDEDLQKELLDESLKFLDAFAKRGGAKEIYLTGISNSFGFVSVLKKLLPDFTRQHNIGLSSHSFRILNGLHSAHEIRDVVWGPPLGPVDDRTVSIYLQGWKGTANFKKIETEKLKEIKVQPETVPFSDQQINLNELDRGARLFMQMIRGTLEYKRRILQGEFFNRYEDEFHPFDENKKMEDVIRGVLESKAEKLLPLVELFDPGAVAELQRKLESAITTLAKNPDIRNRALMRLSDTDAENRYEKFESIGSVFVRRLIQQVKIFEKDQERTPEPDEIEEMLVELDYESVLSEMDIEPPLSVEDLTDLVRDSQPSDGKSSSWRGDLFIALREKANLPPPQINRPTLDVGGIVRRSWMQQVARNFRNVITDLIELRNVEGFGLMTVMDHVEPGLTETFRTQLEQSGDYSAESIRLMVEHPAEMIDYYMSIAKDEGAAASLMSPVDVLALGELFSGSATGLEEKVAEARRQMISFVNERDITATLERIRPTFSPNEPIPLTRLFEKQFNDQALREAGFERGVAQIFGKGIWNPEIRVPAGTFAEALRVHVQPGVIWAPSVEQQLNQAVQDGLIQLVDAEAAQIVVAETDIRTDPLKQILLQVDRNSAGTVTPSLLRHIEDLHQRRLIEAGGVILLYRKGDLDEDVYLFA